MIKNKKRLVIYLNSVVDSVFKILPLFEEKNIGVQVYIESLILELCELDNVIDIDDSYEYISLILTLKSIKKEVSREDSRHTVIKREIFKSINIVKNIISKIESNE